MNPHPNNNHTCKFPNQTKPYNYIQDKKKLLKKTTTIEFTSSCHAEITKVAMQKKLNHPTIQNPPFHINTKELQPVNDECNIKLAL